MCRTSTGLTAHRSAVHRFGQARRPHSEASRKRRRRRNPMVRRPIPTPPTPSSTGWAPDQGSPVWTTVALATTLGAAAEPAATEAALGPEPDPAAVGGAPVTVTVPGT